MARRYRRYPMPRGTRGLLRPPIVCQGRNREHFRPRAASLAREGSMRLECGLNRMIHRRHWRDVPSAPTCRLSTRRSQSVSIEERSRSRGFSSVHAQFSQKVRSVPPPWRPRGCPWAGTTKGCATACAKPLATMAAAVSGRFAPPAASGVAKWTWPGFILPAAIGLIASATGGARVVDLGRGKGPEPAKAPFAAASVFSTSFT